MDLIAARLRALELAIDNAPAGTPWTGILDVAQQFATFVTTGNVPAKDGE